MRHFREDYNSIQDTDGRLGIPLDEPVFLLRGQDVLAPALLLSWAAELRLKGGSPEMARIVENGAQEMIEWQKKIKSKLPDLTTSEFIEL